MLDLTNIKYTKLDDNGKPILKKNKDYDEVAELNRQLAEKYKKEKQKLPQTMSELINNVENGR